MLTVLASSPVHKDANYHDILKDALELRFHRERHVCIKKCQFLANHHTNESVYSLSKSYMLTGTGMNAPRDAQLQKQSVDTLKKQAAQFRFI